jgi:hypothetical protein
MTAWRTAATLVPAGLLAAALGLAPARAQPTKAPPRACFFKQELNSWKEVGDRQVNLKVSVRDIYQVALDAPCLNIRWTQRLGIEDRGSNSICTGDLVTLIVPDQPTGPDRCFGRVTRKLTPEEAAALPPKDRP